VYPNGDRATCTMASALKGKGGEGSGAMPGADAVGLLSQHELTGAIRLIFQ
jgi:hypothetical protein